MRLEIPARNTLCLERVTDTELRCVTRGLRRWGGSPEKRPAVITTSLALTGDGLVYQVEIEEARS